MNEIESVRRNVGIVGLATLSAFLVRESLQRFVTQGTEKVRKLLNDERHPPSET